MAKQPAAAIMAPTDLNPKALRIVMVPSDHLRPADYNPRKWSEEQKVSLKRSLQEHGLVDPIIVNSNPERKNIIIGGHFRLMCAKEMGYTEVPVVYIDIADLDTEKKLNLRLNHSTGEFDWSLLGEYFTEDLLLDAGFTKEELTVNIDFEDPTEGKDADAVPNVRATTIKAGDMFQLGDHRLICGDCTDFSIMDNLFGGVKARIVVTDPPYNVDYGASKNPRHKIRKIENDKMDTPDWMTFNKKVFDNIVTHYEGGDIYVFGASGPEGMRQRLFLVDSFGFHWSATIIWYKDQLVLSPANYQRIYEPCFYGWLTKSTYNGDRKQTELWECPRPKNSKEHPTMKPVELIERAINNSSLRGDIVLDPFCGSGTTLIAAEKTGRKCYAVELEPHYCQVIIDRWEELTGKKSVKL